MPSNRVFEPDMELIREVKKAGGENLKKCYQCATCSVVCNLSPEDRPFPRKEMIMAQWGRADQLLADPDIWICFQCNDCSTHCPREAKPGDVLAAIRTYIYKKYSFPSFMGSALASPAALPILLIIPALVMIISIILFSQGENGFLFMNSETIDFDNFLRHKFVDAFFVLGNIIIFIFAAVGFYRFWKALKNNGPKAEKSFISSALSVLPDILMHKQFNKCGTNKQRTTGHLLLFFGFIGAMFTTGAVMFLVFLPEYLGAIGIDVGHELFHLPLAIANPIKILGAVSGVLICIGSLLLLFRRLRNKDEVGANGYADYLFLYMMTLVGVTGMTSWIFRIVDIASLAYFSYFVHILTVFFLLWYMPYSKFAHMIYRTLALIYARSIGREARA